LLTVLVAKDGRVFFDMDNQLYRARLIKRMGERYAMALSESQVRTFARMASFGMNVRQLPAFLNLSSGEQKRVVQAGIPVSTGDNQFADWIVQARMVNPNVRVAIKGDEAVPYPLVKQIIATLQDKGISRFGLVTDTESLK
jgi:biopolymer transport protein ExbD